MQIDKTTCLNGALWRSDNLAGADAGCSVVEKFLEEHPHSGWGLSIYNTLDGSTAEIECEVENIPRIVSFVYNLEHAYPMTFIGENPATESYVVGMRCTRGCIEMPAAYKDVDGELQRAYLLAELAFPGNVTTAGSGTNRPAKIAEPVSCVR